MAKAYLTALRVDADVEAYQANVALAEAVLKQSENQKNAGTGTGIEVTRAKVQLSNEKQQLLAAQNDRSKVLSAVVARDGIEPGYRAGTYRQAVAMSPPIRLPWNRPSAEALKNRPDIKAQADREAAARLNANSVKFERLPSLYAYADYGTTGTNGSIVSLLPTRDYGVTVRVPIFDGGRRDARRAEIRLSVPPGARYAPTTCASRWSSIFAPRSTVCIPRKNSSKSPRKA